MSLTCGKDFSFSYKSHPSRRGGGCKRIAYQRSHFSTLLGSMQRQVMSHLNHINKETIVRTSAITIVISRKSKLTNNATSALTYINISESELAVQIRTFKNFARNSGDHFSGLKKCHIVKMKHRIIM